MSAHYILGGLGVLVILIAYAGAYYFGTTAGMKALDRAAGYRPRKKK